MVRALALSVLRQRLLDGILRVDRNAMDGLGRKTLVLCRIYSKFQNP